MSHTSASAPLERLTAVLASQQDPGTALAELAVNPIPRAARPELQLLLASARSQLGDENRCSIEQLLSTEALDWDSVFSAAHEHGIIPMLSSHLLDDFSGQLSEPVKARLRCELRSSSRQSLLLTAELIKVIRVLADAGVRSLAYKGPTLALQLFGSINLRQFCDVDILIGRADYPAAKRTFLQAGYEPIILIPPGQESRYVAAGCEMPFSAPGSNALIELQWQVVPRYFSINFETNDFFARARKIKLSGSEIETLSPEDVVLALLVHGSKHCWAQLSWVLDLAVLTRSNTVDWSLVSQRARELRIERLVAVGLGVMSDLLGVPPPVGFASLFSRTRQSVRVLCDNTLRQPPKLGTREKEPLEYFLVQVRLRERLRDRIRFFLRLAFTPGIGEWEKTSLPAVLSPVYFLIRFARIAKTLLAAAVRAQ